MSEPPTLWAKAASDAFYATLREPGMRVDQTTLRLAWERAARAAAAYWEEISWVGTDE